MKTDKIIDAIGSGLFAITAGVIIATLSVGCSGWGKTACTVVDAAESACTVVRFMGDDGTEQLVALNKDELRNIASAKAKGLRATEHLDAGAADASCGASK